MKSKRNGNIRIVKLTLLGLVALFCAAAIAADQSKQDGTAKVVTTPDLTVPKPVVPDSNENDVIVPSDIIAPSSSAKKAESSPYYAKVGNMKITWNEYRYEYSRAASKKFYHGRPSEADTAVFQREVGETLVTNAMLVQEAKRRKLKPDAKVVKQRLDLYDQRFANDPNWPDARTRVLPIIATRAQNDNLREQLESRVRNVRAPNEKQLRKYYAAHPDKFTSPPQTRVSTILLRVDPGAPETDWQKAQEAAEDLVKRLRAGEDFAQMARKYSGDITAEAGGDMGYLHEGMLPGIPGEIVSKLQPGEVSDPIMLMEGITIFYLTSRKPSELNSFAAVKGRATELWKKEQSENAWNNLIAKLKKNTSVELDESLLMPLPPAPVTPAAEKSTEGMNVSKP